MRVAEQPPTRARVVVVCVLVLLAAVCDVVWPLEAPPHTRAILPAIIAIGAALSWAWHAINSAAIAAILAAWQVIRLGMIALGAAVKTGLWDAGRFVSKIWRNLRSFVFSELPRFFKWSYQEVIKLHDWLVKKFAPVLKFLQTVQKHIDDFYTKWIRPITDTINFIRVLNRTLQVFHVKVLEGIDNALSAFESYVNSRFAWLRFEINIIRDWIDRILTLDGYFQRFMIIGSMAKYAPDWMRIAVNSRKRPVSGAEYGKLREAFGGRTLPEVTAATEAALLGREGAYAPFVAEFSAQWRFYLESKGGTTSLTARSS
jgi:hypothetical protein